jgi:hypothetical protein
VLLNRELDINVFLRMARMDLRPAFFAGLRWYDELAEPKDDEISAWRVAKWTDSAWWIDLLNAGLSFARVHGLESRFRASFASIRPQDLLHQRAQAEGRSVSFPIWEIANELIVAGYLERVCGWDLIQHEPAGHGARLGDWQFRSQSGRQVFVEVKSLAEMRPSGNSVFNRGSYAPRLRGVLARAYRQLPADDRAVLVVLVGDWLLEIPFGIMHGDLFAALYGKYEVRFQAMVPDPQITYAGPSFREMMVHRGKHRRLGTVAGLITRGCDEPGPALYAIDNPFASPTQRLTESDLQDVRRFVVDDTGFGKEIAGVDPSECWGRMSSLLEQR